MRTLDTKRALEARAHWSHLLMTSAHTCHDTMAYGLAYLGQLHLWRDAHLTDVEKADTTKVWNRPELLELSQLRQHDPLALHEDYVELLFMDSAHMWAQFMVAHQHQKVVAEPSGADFTTFGEATL